MKLVIATKNKNKFVEIQNKFKKVKDLELIPLNHFHNSPDVIEDGSTFEENALKKARAIALFTRSPALADDSGLVVEALDGRPGIYSARYGGDEKTDEDRNKLLLQEMKLFPKNRNAKFVCVIAIVIPNVGEYTMRGECNGIITDSLKGTHGFGYDPVFYLPQFNKTMAQLDLDLKNQISHRAVALDKIENLLQKIPTQ